MHPQHFIAFQADPEASGPEWSQPGIRADRPAVTEPVQETTSGTRERIRLRPERTWGKPSYGSWKRPFLPVVSTSSLSIAPQRQSNPWDGGRCQEAG